MFERFYRLATVVAAAGLLGPGCVVGPDFSPPATPASDGYAAAAPPKTVAGDENTAAPAAAAQTLVDGRDIPGDWWTLFHSPALNGLVVQALKANPDIVAAQAALREAQESVAVAAGGYLPTGSGSFQATRQKENGAELGEPGFSYLYNLYNTSVSVSYSPDLFGGVHRQVEASAAEADDARYQLEATYLTLSANVVTAAIQEASLRGQITATEAIIEDERHQLDILGRQFELGGVPKADVLSEQAQLAQAEATLPPLRKALAQTRTELTVYLGRPPSQEPTEQFTLDSLTLPEELPLSLPSALVEQRPDIREAEAALHEASANIGVAIANMLPQLTLTGSFGDASITAGNVLNPASNIWSLGAGLTQPLLNEITLARKKKVAEAAFDEAAAQYRSAVLKGFQDVANTLHAIESDAMALRAEVTAETAAAQSLAIAKDQYQIGAITYPTLLDAQKTEEQSLVSLVQARAARYADTAALFQALGGGWWNRGDAEQSADAAPSVAQKN